MHAHKTQAERIGCRECTFAHQRGNHGDLQLFCHREQFLFGMGRNDAAADVENGALRFLHHLACLADLANIALNRRLVRGNKHILRVLEHHLRTSEVGRNINKNRARTTRVGNIERLTESLGHVVAALKQIAVLHDGHGDTHDIGFLERIGADNAAGNLTSDYHHRDTVHVGGGDTGNRIGSTRAGSHNDDTGFASGASVAIGLMGRTLLMASKNMVDLLRVIQGIVDLDSLTTRITEYCVHTFGFKRSDDGFCTQHLLALFFGMRTEAHLGFVFLIDHAHPKYAPLSALETSFA